MTNDKFAMTNFFSVSSVSPWLFWKSESYFESFLREFGSMDRGVG